MKRLAGFLVCLTAAATDPAWLTNLSNSTYIWSPYPVTSMPAWGGSYIDGHHTLPVMRIPALPATCSIPNWNPSAQAVYPPLSGVFYGGQYWMIPYSAGVPSTGGLAPSTPPWQVVSQADVCAARSVVTSYSGRQAWNANQTEFYVIAANSTDSMYFYKWNNGSPTFDFSLENTNASTTNGDESWSHSDPSRMFYANRSGYTIGDTCPNSTPCLENITITPGNPSTAAISVEHSWTIGAAGECPAGTTYVLSGGDSAMSEDDRYRVLYCATGSGTPTRLIVYDYTTHSVVSSRDISAMCNSCGSGIDIVTMSPDGDFVMVAWEPAVPAKEDTWTTGHGVELFDRATLTSQGMINSIDEGHMDVGRDVNGYEIAALPSGNSFSLESNARYWSFNAVKLADVHPPNQGGTWDSYGEVDIPVTANSTNTILQFASNVDFSTISVGAYISDKTTAGSPVAPNASSGGIPASTTVQKVCKTVGTGCTTANTIVMNHAAVGVTNGDVIAFRESLLASYSHRLYLPCSVYSRGPAVLTTSAATTTGATLYLSDTTGVSAGLTASGINIPDGTTVLSFAANTSVTLSASVTGSGVASGAQIEFLGDPYTGCTGGGYNSMTAHMSGRGAGAGPSQGWFLYSIFTSPGLAPQIPGWGRNEALAVRIDTTQPVVSNVPFRRIANMMTFRQNGSQTQCSQGQDYWQEPHATASPDFTKVLFTSSWLTECGQDSVFSVNLAGGTMPAMTVTPMSQTVAAGSISWIIHSPAAAYAWTISPADCVTNSGSGSGDGSLVISTCNTAGAHVLTVNDTQTTVTPAFSVTAYAPLVVTPTSVSIPNFTSQMFSVTGGLAPYTWSAPGAITTAGTGTTFTTSWAAANRYSLTVTDATSSTAVANITVSISSPVKLNGTIRIAGRAHAK